MELISVIGHTEGAPEEAEHGGKRFLRLSVRAEGSAQVYTAVTSRLSLRETLAPGTEVFVSGHLSLAAGKGSVRATVQALLIRPLGGRERSAEDLAMEMFTNPIPLQSI